MSSPIATAFVEIRGETSRLGPDVVNSVQQEMVKSGKAISDAIVKPINEASKTTSSIFAGIGQSIKNAIQPATQQVGNFVSGFKSTEAAAASASGRMGSFGGAVRTAFEPAIQQVNNFTSGFRSSEAAASAFSGRMGSLGGVVSSAFKNTNAVVRDFQNIGSQVATRLGGAFSEAATSIQTKFASTFASVRSGALGLGAVVGFGGIGALIGAGFSRLSDIEQTTKSLQVMTGSAASAKLVMNDLLTFAKTTPFAFPDISQIGRNLVAFGVDTTKVVPILKSLGDAASASGQGVQAMQSLGNAIGSVAIAGKISGVDLQSFQAVGVPALKILANTAGVSADEMSKRISKGSVDSKFAIDSLVKGIENGTTGLAGATAKMGGIMAAQKDTIAGTMDSLKSSVTSTMATLLEPAIPAFRGAVNTFSAEFKKIPGALTAAKAQLTSLGFFEALRVLFSGIGAIISGVLPLIQGFARGFMTVFGAGLLVGIRALGVAFQWVGGIIQAWRPVLQPIITILGALWAATALIRGAMLAGGAAMLIWHGIMVAFGPVMKIITALQWAFNAAMDANPITLIILAIIALVAAFVILWNRSAAFRDFWIGIWNAIGDIISFAWNHGIKPIFEAIKDGIHKVGDVFNSVKDFIGRVWDNLGDIAMKPIRFIVNTVLDDGLINGWNKVVDFLKLGFLHIPPIPRLATGGIIPGYTPGVDNHVIAVGGGEAVMRPEWTRAAGASYVHGANQAARFGGVSGAGAFIAQNGLPGFAGGGIIDSIGNFFKGAWNGLVNIGGMALDFLKDPIGGMQKLLDSIIGGIGIGGLGDIGQLGQLVTQAPKSLVGGMVQKIREWWNSSGASSAGGGQVSFNASAGVAQWAPLILQALAALGQPGSWLQTVERRMNQESGGNPNAINRTDINAQRGDPSRGLMQTIGSTFNAYRNPAWSGNIYDPLANIFAGLNYAIHRYGSLSALNRPGGYALGGIPLFDGGGGLPPGLSLANNQTGRVETIHDPNVDDQILTTLQTISALLERRPIVGVTVAMDGHVIQKYFQEAEILGGL